MNHSEVGSSGINGGEGGVYHPHSSGGGLVSLVKQVRRELEEKFEKGMSQQLEQFRNVEESLKGEVAILKRELGEEKEQRVESDRRFQHQIDVLAEENIQLRLADIELEEKVKALEQKNVAERADVQGDVGMVPPPAPEEVVENSSAPVLPQSEKENTGVVVVASNDNDDLVEGEGEHNDNDSSSGDSSDVEVEILHGKASKPGRRLPFLCLCGLQFRSEKLFSKHVLHGSARPKGRITRARAQRRSIASRTPRGEAEQNATTSGVQQPEGSNVLEAPSSSSSSSRKLHGRDPSRRLGCLCGKTYPHGFALQQHLKYYSIYRNRFACEECGKRFSFQCRLQHHIAKGHRTPRLRRPMRTSTVQVEPSSSAPGEGRNGNQRGDHYAVTVGERSVDEKRNRRFHCRCGRSYFRMDILNTHIRGMKAGKVFKCRLCPKKYHGHHMLWWHVKYFHKAAYWNTGKIVCCSCAETFESRIELRKHRTAKHRDELVTG